jgi:hypothetical protein
MEFNMMEFVPGSGANKFVFDPMLLDEVRLFAAVRGQQLTCIVVCQQHKLTTIARHTTNRAFECWASNGSCHTSTSIRRTSEKL